MELTTEEEGMLPKSFMRPALHRYQNQRTSQEKEITGQYPWCKNPQQNISKTKGISHRNRTNNPKICMEQETAISQSNFEKEKQSWRHHAFWFQTTTDPWTRVWIGQVPFIHTFFSIVNSIVPYNLWLNESADTEETWIGGPTSYTWIFSYTEGWCSRVNCIL